MFPVKIVESFVRGVTYKPSWTFRVEQIVDEIAIIVVQFYTPDSDVKWAPHYDGAGAMISTGYTMDLGGVRDMDDLARVFFRDIIMQAEMHENREFYSVGGTAYDKPVHPHTIDGMVTWARWRPEILVAQAT